MSAREAAGALIGLLFTYLFGSLIAWSFNPADWWLLWRLWCAMWAIFWMIFGAALGGKP